MLTLAWVQVNRTGGHARRCAPTVAFRQAAEEAEIPCVPLLAKEFRIFPEFFRRRTQGKGYRGCAPRIFLFPLLLLEKGIKGMRYSAF